MQFSIAVPIYNAFLAVYYMLVIKYRVSEVELKGKIESAMHVSSFIWGFGTAFTSVVMGYMNDPNLWCWIAPYPGDCLDSWVHGEIKSLENPCIRGEHAWIFRWVFYFAPLWTCILVASKYGSMCCQGATLLYRSFLVLIIMVSSPLTLNA